MAGQVQIRILQKAQDIQDIEDETLRHRTLTRSMIGCAYDVIHELGSSLGYLVVEKAMGELMTVKPIAK